MNNHIRFAQCSANTFIAAALALYAGFALGLPRPYWAVTSAYLVAQPLSGATRSKGAFRLLGTGLGAVAAITMVPALDNAPVMLVAAIALWTGTCAFIALLDRTPRSYIFLLAGYTTPIIAFPVADAPAAIFDIAVARAEEISLGVICATMVNSLVFPRSVGDAITLQVEGWASDANRLATRLLGPHSATALNDARKRLVTAVAELRTLATHLPFDTSNLKEMASAVVHLQDAMSTRLPALSEITDRLDWLRAEGSLSPDLEAAVQDLAAWLGDQHAPPHDAARLVARFEALASTIHEQASWPDLMRESLLHSLCELIRSEAESRRLRRLISTSDRGSPLPLSNARSSVSARLHRDPVLALIAAMPVVTAVIGCCALWIGLDWPEGGLAALYAAIFASIVAGQENPAGAAASCVRYTIISIGLLGFYQFVVLPAIDGYVELIFAMSFLLLPIGYLVANPKTTIRGVTLVLGVNGLGLSQMYSADFAVYANNSIAAVAGVAIVFVSTQIFRAAGANWSARRLLRANWREVASAADASRTPGLSGRTARMIDRAALLSMRLPDRVQVMTTALNEVSIAQNLQSLVWAETRLTYSRKSAQRLLERVRRGYLAFAHDGVPVEQAQLGLRLAPISARDLDRVLTEVSAGAASNPIMREAAISLVALRRALLPGAPPYAPGRPPRQDRLG